MARNNPKHDMPDEMMRLLRARDAYDYGGHLGSSAQHTAYLTTELVDDFAIAGPVEHCMDQLRALADIGVEKFRSHTTMARSSRWNESAARSSPSWRA